MTQLIKNACRNRLAMVLSTTAAALLASGCTVTSQLQPYRDAGDGQSARVRVVSNEIVAATPGRSCFDHAGDLGGGIVLGGHATPRDHRGRQIGMPPSSTVPGQPETPPGADSAEIRVATDRPVTLSMRSKVDSPWICNVGVTFTPRTGEDYEASMVADGEHKVCQAMVRSLTHPSETVPQSSARACAPTL